MPTTPTVTPRYRACGDDWAFALSFVQADGVTPFDVSAYTITADFWVAYQPAYLSRLLVGSGLTVTNPTEGLAQVVVPGALTAPPVVAPQDPWSPALAFALTPSYPTRLVIGLSQGGVHRTVEIVFICPYLAGSVSAQPVDDESPIVITVSSFITSTAELGSSLDLNIPGNFALQ